MGGSHIQRASSSASHDYKAQRDDEVSVAAGDELEVLAPDKGGMTHVRNVSQSGNEGLIPTRYLLVEL